MALGSVFVTCCWLHHPVALSAGPQNTDGEANQRHRARLRKERRAAGRGGQVHVDDQDNTMRQEMGRPTYPLTTPAMLRPVSALVTSGDTSAASARM